MVKLALKRADIGDLVRGDVGLCSTPFVKAIGSRVDAVLKLGVARRYPNRSVLFQQGDSGNSLFFVLRGDVRLSGRKGADMVELGNATRGDVVGEAEVLSGETLRLSSAVAQGEVEAVEVPREALVEKGGLIREVAAFLRPIKEARLSALSEMTDFMNRW